MLVKRVSYASSNRGIRDNEVDGIDYKFVPKEHILSLRDSGALLQFTENKKSGVVYGYEKASFTNIEELIVVCGGSGSGKDSSLNSLSIGNHLLFNNIDSGFLFSVPDTLHIFDTYCKENSIPCTMVYLYAPEATRISRIVRGVLLSNNYFIQKYNITKENSSLFIVETNSKKEVFLSVGGSDRLAKEVIASSISRVERDEAIDFDSGVKLAISKGINIKTIDTSCLSQEEVELAIISQIETNRRVVD